MAYVIDANANEDMIDANEVDANEDMIDANANEVEIEADEVVMIEADDDWEEQLCDDYKLQVLDFSPSETASLLERLIIQNRFKEKDENCGICLDSMYKTKCEYLPCKHVFHYKCLEQLIERRTYTCPFCRYNFKDTLIPAGKVMLNANGNGNDAANAIGANNNQTFTMTIFTQMDVYDFILEMLWITYGPPTS